MVNDHKSTGEIKNLKNKQTTPEIPKPKETNSPKVKRTSTYAEVVKNSKVIHMTENKNKTTETVKENNKSVYVELDNKSKKLDICENES